ncbi:beta-1,3-galactosyltransferase 5-like [Thrips palmi]|uniref:Hexosyltransferase n=1 Tax=Thrips palmi TaxID=161013 RepID=A0A6P8YCG3_THRPL|nr:beta-1,3-galactosyltransferase 5-like [Thrips palmi]
MAVRVRVLQSLVLALVCLSLVVYSSYYATASGPSGPQLPQQAAAQRAPPPPPSQPQLPSSQTSVGTVDLFTGRLGRNASATLQALQDDPLGGSLLVGGVNASTIAEEVGAVIVGVGSVSLANGLGGVGGFNALPPVARPPPAANATLSTPAPSGGGGGSIQRIPPPAKDGNATLDATIKGVVTRSIYEAGHDVANLEICPDLGRNLQVFIAVTSAPSHREARMAVRQTWGHFQQRSDVAIAFILGTTNNPEMEKSLAAESAMYNDLIRGRFVDSYNNLTLKTISTLEWVDNYCSEVKFILKTDDDMFINVNKLMAFITKHADVKRTIFGRLAKKWKPIRNKKSKYYVSPQQYKRVVFPDFTTGPAYLMSQDVVHDLYTTALNQMYLKLEDVYTTGIVAHSVNVKRVHVNEFLNKRVAFNACNIQKGISIHMVKYHEQFDLWKKLLDGRTKCK